ncbi:hypothetical protein [Croceiramulus getboli]|nr:sigma-70 region 4 domain-containing protein [Flavobacteriaceae bacterium YJPT1-3]
MSTSFSNNKAPQKNYRLYVEQYYQQLYRYRSDEQRDQFLAMLIALLPELEGYVKLRLDQAVHAGNFPHNKYKPQDVTDDLYLILYASFDEIDNEDEFYLWLFEKTNQVIEELIANEAEYAARFESLDRYSNAEWRGLKERFTSEFDGDLIMKEDLTDVSYKIPKLQWSHFLTGTDKEQEWDQKIDALLQQEQADQELDRLLERLSFRVREIVQLHHKYLFSVAEIARLKNESKGDVEQALEEAKRIIQVSLFNS